MVQRYEHTRSLLRDSVRVIEGSALGVSLYMTGKLEHIAYRKQITITSGALL